MKHAWTDEKMHTKFWSENLKGILGRFRRRWNDIRMDVREMVGRRELDASSSG
jgi:hypothetical protein